MTNYNATLCELGYYQYYNLIYIKKTLDKEVSYFMLYSVMR